MKLAAYIGIPISEFWELCPKELSVIAEAYSDRKKEESEEYKAKLENEQMMLTYQAYLISRWVWAKKIDIKSILKSNGRPQQMTPESILNQVKILNSVFGGEVT